MRIIGCFDPAKKFSLTEGLNNYETHSGIFFNNLQFKTIEDSLIFFNGIIYNEEELKKMFNFEIESQADLVYHLYKKNGISSFRIINGKATIMIKNAEQTIVFRDHHGEAIPFFHSNDYFSDSIDGLKKIDKIKWKPNLVSISTFLKIGFIPAPLTAFEGIFKVPAGTVLIYSKSGFKSINLFDFEDFKSETIQISMEDAVQEYDRLLKASIQKRIKHFEPVGALLSGGYDSGGNIAALREVFSGKIKTYSIGFKDNPFSELPYAKLMAETFEAEHHEYQMDGSEIEQLPFVIKAFGEPFSESGFMLNNAAMNLIQNENLPVVIGGDGNDQLFGTTGKEMAIHFKLRKMGLNPIQKLVSTMADNSFFEKDSKFFKLRFHNEKILNVMRPDNFGFNNHTMKSMFNFGRISDHPYIMDIPTHFTSYSNLHDQHNFYLDIRHSINEVILNKASRLAAAYGNNLAFTYVDLDIYDFIRKLPLEIRLKGTIDELAKGKGVTKYLHKVHTKPKLPADVTSRKKQGGFSPLAIFLSEENLRKKIYNYIEKSEFSRQYINMNELKNFFDSYEQNSKSGGYWFWYRQLRSNQMFNLLISCLWWDIYIKDCKKSTLSEFLK